MLGLIGAAQLLLRSFDSYGWKKTRKKARRV